MSLEEAEALGFGTGGSECPWKAWRCPLLLDPDTELLFEDWNNKTRNAPCNPGVPIPQYCKDKVDPAIVDCVVEDLMYYSQLHVDKHNEYRRLHKDTPDLEIDLDIACRVYEWVDWMAKEEKGIW